jgi:protocatechuate 3,4-dioxygenase beta subunit
MHHDDLPVGRVLPRRHALGLLGMVGAALTVGAGTASATPNVDCVATPEMIEGPYFVDEKLRRSDIRTDPATGRLPDGALVALNLRVLQIAAGRCTPLPGATVDPWQCDAVGLYSDEADANTVGQKFLRGYQVSDRTGQVRFTTMPTASTAPSATNSC